MASQRTFRLDDELDARLVKEAERQGRSVSNLIVWAIVRELASAAVVGTPLPKIAPRKKR